MARDGRGALMDHVDVPRVGALGITPLMAVEHLAGDGRLCFGVHATAGRPDRARAGEGVVASP